MLYCIRGAATAAYQIEGAYSEDGRGATVWDDFSHTPGKTANGDTGDVADNSYHLFHEDIKLMKEMGINSYRFSLSWSRIVPDGEGAINQAGIDHYNALIDALMTANITPYVTLYHWDTPLHLEQEYGGWLNKTMETCTYVSAVLHKIIRCHVYADRNILYFLFVLDFSAYADICFNSFGDRVKHWMTINEPMTVAINGYLTGDHAPGRCSDRTVCTDGNSSTEPYVAAHNMLNAHAAAAEVYHTQYASQRGVIAMVINTDYAYPFNTSSPEDWQAAQRYLTIVVLSYPVVGPLLLCSKIV